MSGLQTLQVSSAFRGQSDEQGMKPLLKPGLGMWDLTAAEPVPWLPLDRAIRPPQGESCFDFGTGKKSLIQVYVFLVQLKLKNQRLLGPWPFLAAADK